MSTPKSLAKRYAIGTEELGRDGSTHYIVVTTSNGMKRWRKRKESADVGDKETKVKMEKRRKPPTREKIDTEKREKKKIETKTVKKVEAKVMSAEERDTKRKARRLKQRAEWDAQVARDAEVAQKVEEKKKDAEIISFPVFVVAGAPGTGKTWFCSHIQIAEGLLGLPLKTVDLDSINTFLLPNGRGGYVYRNDPAALEVTQKRILAEIGAASSENSSSAIVFCGLSVWSGQDLFRGISHVRKIWRDIPDAAWLYRSVMRRDLNLSDEKASAAASWIARASAAEAKVRDGEYGEYDVPKTETERQQRYRDIKLFLSKEERTVLFDREEIDNILISTFHHAWSFVRRDPILILHEFAKTKREEHLSKGYVAMWEDDITPFIERVITDRRRALTTRI